MPVFYSGRVGIWRCCFLYGDLVFFMEMLFFFMEQGKLDSPEEIPRSKPRNQQQTQPTYDTGPEANSGHIGGRRKLSPLHNTGSQ